jgi:hypothetical protein
MTRLARRVERMEPAEPALVLSLPRDRRRCRRCGAYLCASNEEPLCFPCQRHEHEELWTGARRHGRSFPSRHQAIVGG